MLLYRLTNPLVMLHVYINLEDASVSYTDTTRLHHWRIQRGGTGDDHWAYPLCLERKNFSVAVMPR